VNTVSTKLVRVQDRLTLAKDASPVWRINPRTGTLDTRAGLSWTGTRPYRTATGVVVVLRRPEQVNSPGHCRTLHRLSTPEGHPAGDVNIDPSNWEALTCGWTGDSIDVESLNGYARPVGNISVFRPSTIANMADDETWAEYIDLFPDVAAAVTRMSGITPRTGTSLGYNALWLGPNVDSEIVTERDDGSLVGEWLGPNGPERYDVEHIVDPDCEIVQRLKVETGFRPELLGANHEAVGLATLGGRGAEQSELMRIVDSRSLPITADQSRVLTRVALQVNRVVTSETESTDATDPKLDAASQPPIVTPIADANKATPMNKKTLEFALGRDNVKALTKLGMPVPQGLALALDEIDVAKLEPVLVEFQNVFGTLMEMLGAAQGEAEGVKAKMADMVPAAEAQANVDKIKEQLAAAEAALAESKEAEGKATADVAKAQETIDTLNAELAPLRDAEFKTLCADAIAAGYDANKVADCKDAAALRRYVVITHPKLGEAKYGKASDERIADAFDGVWASRPTVALVPDPKATKKTSDEGRTSTLSGVPTVTTQRTADSKETPVTVNTVDEMDG
jgi:predicted transglutaminase-like cysteine proteinase